MHYVLSVTLVTVRRRLFVVLHACHAIVFDDADPIWHGFEVNAKGFYLKDPFACLRCTVSVV